MDETAVSGRRSGGRIIYSLAVGGRYAQARKARPLAGPHANPDGSQERVRLTKTGSVLLLVFLLLLWSPILVFAWTISPAAGLSAIAGAVFVIFCCTDGTGSGPNRSWGQGARGRQNQRWL